MTTPTAPPDALAPHLTDLHRALSRLRDEARAYAVAKLDHWRLQAEQLIALDNPADTAVVHGVEAAVTGKNPLLAAARGAWSTADGATKAKLVALLLLVALLAPVLLLLVLLALLIGVATGKLPTGAVPSL